MVNFLSNEIYSIKKMKALNFKNLFLIDAFGAFVSACLLLFVLRNFEEAFGVNKNALNKLSLIAFIFSIYSISCFYFVKNNWKPFLSFIAFANLLYCFLTLIVVLDNYQTITSLGVAYFFVEVILIFALVIIELKKVKK